jgi:CheY-like chemotaxis protein
LLRILWVDDEISHLQAHIRFLEKRGYTVYTAESGRMALDILKSRRVDLVLLDQMMVGMDGLETVMEIRRSYRELPIVMVTQSEEEELMDRALTGTVADFLTKPVNPSQILLVVKKLLTSGKLKLQHAAMEVMHEAETLRLSRDRSLSDWIHLYASWMEKDITTKGHLASDYGSFQGIGLDQLQMDFSRFLEDNYRDWISSDSGPVMSHTFLEKVVLPHLDTPGELVLMVIDCMRYDQWLLMTREIEQWFHREPGFMIAGLPSATPYSRNSIFSGLLPRDISRFYRNDWIEEYGAPGLNRSEPRFLVDALKRLGWSGAENAVYLKASNKREGDNIRKGLSHFVRSGFLALVVNYIDHLTHGRSELDLIRDLAPDVGSFRALAESWFRSSFLREMLLTLSARGAKIIVTSDHGSVQARRVAWVRGARGMSSSVRYRFGLSLFGDPRQSLVIKQPAVWGLPDDNPRKSYVLARGDYMLFHESVAREDLRNFKGSFQHGGVSMDEMIVPCDVLTPRRLM